MDAAVAQETAASPDAGEIIVTAQRRKENAQDIPISIQAISAKELQTLGTKSLTDLHNYVPGLSFGDTSSFGRAGIRGVLDYSRNAGYDARVGIYVDGVYMGRSYMNNVSLVDVERVEVLRGPQGTLFGKNTDAGVINVVTRKPSDDFSAIAAAEIGNFGHHKADGYLNLPLVADRLALSVALSKTDSKGYYYNRTFNKRMQGIDHFSGRIQLRFQPNDALDINLSLDGQRYRDDIVYYNRFGAYGPDPFIYDSPTDDYDNSGNYGGTLSVDYTLPSDITLSNIMDYREASNRKLFNGQGGAVDWLNGRYFDKVKQFSEEFRVATPKTERFDAVLGLYYFNLRDDQDRGIVGGNGLGAIGLGAYTGLDLKSLARVSTNSYAAFANGNIRFGKLELSLGVRYTIEKKKLNYQMLDPIGALLGFTPVPLVDDRTDKQFTPKAAINYRVTPDLMIYASYARGFKSGGWAADFDTNAQLANGVAGIRVDAETANSYEIGFKSDFMRRRGRFNVTGFITKFKKFQVFQLTQRIVNGQTVAQTALTNSGEVTSKGIEAESSFEFIRGVTFSGNMTYNLARFDSFPGGAGTFNGLPVDASGTTLPYAPKWKAYGALDIDLPVVSWANLLAHIGVSSQTKQNSDTKVANPNPLRSSLYKLPGYTLLDGRIGLGSTAKGWKVELWAKNLMDKHYKLYSTEPTIGTFAIGRYGEPRTYGIAGRFTF